MATYLKPIVLEDVFNIINFQQIQNNTTSFLGYAQLTLSNTFKNINTFLSDVFVNGTLYVTNLNISHTFLGYNISMFNGLKAPIQAQFDSITTGGNVNIQSTVSVDKTITVSNETPASVENVGTNINANLRFYIPEGAPAIQPEFSIGDVKTTASPSVTLTGTTIKPVLNFGLVTGNNGITPSFSIGTVTSQSTPSVSLTGTTANPVLNFGLQKGDTGAAGKDATQPSFSIGTVSSASTPSVSLGGTNPNYQLNFNLVPGLNGTTPTFKVGTVTDSSNASVSLGGTAPNYELNFGLVPGTTPTFKIGTVESSSNPYVNISYDSSINPVLNFGLKQGEPGPTGPPGKDSEVPGPKGEPGPSGADGNSTTANILSFFALSAVITAVGGAMAAYIVTNGALEALKSAGYATVIWVNSKVLHFTAYDGSQKCDASLTLQNGALGNTILLSNQADSNSYFGNTVDFKKDISVQGKIVNTNSSSSIDIKAEKNDLNMTSTTKAINLYAGTQISFNAPSVINSGNLNVNNIKPIATTDDLNIGHDTIVCTPETVLKVNTISEMYDMSGNPSNLTITNPKLIVNNKICCDKLTFFNEANNELDISHSVVNILGILKTDEITSLRDPDDLLDPTELQIKHEIVKIPEVLKVDRLRSLIDPAVGQTLASELNINHDFVRIEETLLVNKIETSTTTEQLEANPNLKTKLEITHEEIRIPNLTYLTNLKTDTINPFSDTVTVPPTESSLTISHDNVLITHKLKIDEITSLRQPDDMIDPTTLEIKHEVVKIPESLQVDRISSVTVPPVTNPPTETFMTISHDNVTISNKLKVDKIIPNTVPYPARPYTELVISHNYVEIAGILQTNNIRAINTDTDTIEMQGKIINITAAPVKTLPVDPDSQVNITADKTSIRGKEIYIGNLDGSSDIRIIGNCRFYNTENENAFWNEVDGLIQQNLGLGI